MFTILTWSVRSVESISPVAHIEEKVRGQTPPPKKILHTILTHTGVMGQNPSKRNPMCATAFDNPICLTALSRISWCVAVAFYASTIIF